MKYNDHIKGNHTKRETKRNREDNKTKTPQNSIEQHGNHFR